MRDIKCLILLERGGEPSSASAILRNYNASATNLIINEIVVEATGIEPTSSRLKGECISISANPANLVGDAGIEPAWSRLRVECICHLCQLPMFNKSGAGCWNRTNASRLSTAGSTFELILHGAPFGS